MTKSKLVLTDVFNVHAKSQILHISLIFYNVEVRSKAFMVNLGIYGILLEEANLW